MKRRRTVSREPAKTRHRKATKQKRNTASTAARQASSSVAELQKQLERQARELDEAREQQRATSEVLNVISSSPGELEPVFQAMLANATRICEAKFGNLWLREGDSFRITATFGAPSAYREYFDLEPAVHPDPRSGLGTIVRTKKEIHIADIRSPTTFKDKMRIATIKLAKARSLVAVPLLKDGEVVGAIAIYRQQVRPYTDKQVALLSNFASQAVIAIENSRLLTELRQRTADLTESLEQQTATSTVLEVISRSAFDLQTVLDTLVESATRLCNAQDAFIFLPSGDLYRVAARYGFTPEFHEFIKSNPITIDQGSVVGRTAIDGRLVHISDVLSDPKYTRHDGQKIGGFRAALGIPLLRERNVVGVVFLTRTKPQPFTDKQIELAQTFADQAAIAIENVRLLKELRGRTEEVEELNQHLEQRVADQVGEIERMGRLRRFLPPQVADLIVASGTEKQLESHRHSVQACRCT